MTHAFADAPRRMVDSGAPTLVLVPPIGRGSSRPRVPALVRPLWFAIAGLTATATVALVATPARSSAQAAGVQGPGAVAAADVLRLTCAPTYVGDGAAFNATFAVSGGPVSGAAANVARWQVDYGDGTTAAASSVAA